MDIVEQMRSFESDHEPDGWPAIQMKQVSALCDEVERSQRLLNGMASEVERLQSLLEQERKESLTASCRVAALEMELDSATSIIDSANAQEPEGYLCDFEFYVSIESAKANCGAGCAVTTVLARPIPAQQSPAVAVPASVDIGFIEDCLIAYKSGLYFDGAEGLRNKIDQQLSAIKQQSPRITEHDAREIALSAWRYWMNNCDRTVDNWVEDEGLDLINKLNGVTNETN